MKLAKGFQYSGVHAGIKPNRKDLALVFSKTPCAAAACVTENKAAAAPIIDVAKRLPASGIHAVVVNSGNANALTGAQGLQDVVTSCGAVGKALGVSGDAVVAASTGVIGVRLPVHKVEAAASELAKQLRTDPDAAAQAILTTDTRVKMTSASLTVGGKEVTLTAICKGSGMIHPQLATMIAIVSTDCDISPEMLQRALVASMASSFNSLTVDGDMSTNDVVFALANGMAKNPPLREDGPDYQAFEAVLRGICEELAREIAADGEGATKLLEIEVTGAPSVEMARDIAKAIAGSSLVKAAMFGADPNWGRVLATVGARAGSQKYAIDPYTARVVIQDVLVYDREPVAHQAETLRARMRQPRVLVSVELRDVGTARAVAWGCDLSYDYVKINADYTSLIVQKPDGGVAKDDRLSNYSPSFKVTLLVEALSYISQFSGKRCVVKFGGEAMVKESLKRSFCNDLMLLRAAGLSPVVVHGGGPETQKALKRIGKGPAFMASVHASETNDARVLEMVLTGVVNTELVTLLNREGGSAVGVSGKDGALLRARPSKEGSLLGEVSAVNRGFLDMLLSQGYLPVISPVGIGEDGESYQLDADAVAAEVASSLGAAKLIYLSDAPGLLRGADLVSELTSDELREELRKTTIKGGMRRKAEALLRALSSGVDRAHIIDGRVPHSMVAELFTDHGVGTLVTRTGSGT
ncbi:MAG: bifunctional glutamate N-acetyltransferase/amino-acid acetyltransferase ArgJ [Myxococcaceae bacterium]